jgi:hypothetical protein
VSRSCVVVAPTETMKKISKRLSLARHTVRVMSTDDTAVAVGGGAQPTTTVLRHSVNAAAAVCRIPTGTVYTAPCRYPG